MPTTRDRLVASAAIAGGVLMAAGAFLPWLSLYAGLYPLRGVIGLNGRIVAAGGAICLAAGITSWLRPASRVRSLVALVGGGLTGFCVWLIVQLLITYRNLGTNPMLVPRLGPGLFVAVAGSLLAGASAITLWSAVRPASRG
jgi:hypothetical protein